MTTPGFVILSQGRDQPDVTLALADKDKRPGKYWTTRITEAKVYLSETAAKNRTAQIKYNNPRYVPFEEARKALEEQARTQHKPINPVLYPGERRK